ncbi:hypothetical protein FACS189434_00260 [Bacteroidia bacterium]|nr:hypothetical protein FACS189434_00260 [Bacteroidia bacterium]
MKKTLFILFFLFSILDIYAAPANKNLRTETQQNGVTVSYFVRGDEKFRYFLTTDGYTLLRNTDGIFVYAQKDENGNLLAGNILAHNEGERTPAETAFLATIEPFLTYSETQIAAFLEKWQDLSPAPQKAKSTFTVADNTNPDTKNNRHTHNLVILVNFSDKSFVVENPQQKFSDMLNQTNYRDNGATGSVRDYFSDNSMGTYQPDFVVTAPVTLPQTQAYYAQSETRNRQMIVDACNAVNTTINFTEFDSDNDGFVDNVCVIFAGNNASEMAGNLIVPHTWWLATDITLDGVKIHDYMCTSELQGNGATAASICGIGTFTHEFSHILGLPDMYNDNVIYCLEEWDIMDYGLYNNVGRTPPAYSAYERYFMGWLVPEILTVPANETLEDLKSANRALIIVNSTLNYNGFLPSPTEFFLLENRQQSDWDSYLPHHGLLVWHINYNAADWNANIPNNPSRKGIYIEPADGRASKPTQAGDTYPGTSGKTSFTPRLWNRTYIGNSLTNIAETDGIISFDYVSGIVTLYNTASSDLKVWTSGHHIFLSGIEKNTKIDVYQTDGKQIFSKNTSDFTAETPVLQTGIYVLKLQSNEKTSTIKVVIH